MLKVNNNPKKLIIENDQLEAVGTQLALLSDAFKYNLLDIKKNIYLNAHNNIITVLDFNTIPKLLAFFESSDYITYNQFLNDKKQQEIINLYLKVNQKVSNDVNHFSAITFSILLSLISDLDIKLRIIKIEDADEYWVITEDQDLVNSPRSEISLNMRVH